LLTIKKTTTKDISDESGEV